MKYLFKNILRSLLLFVFCFCAHHGFGQLGNPLTQYSRLPYLYNAGASGIENLTDVKVGMRYQWISADDAPKGYFLGINHTFQKEGTKAKIGLGGFIIQENADIYQDLQVGLSAAVHIPLSQFFNLSLGFKVDYNRMAANLDEIRARDEQDLYYQNLMASDGVVSYLDISPGIMLYSKNFYVGYSSLQLVRANMEEAGDSEENAGIRHTAMIGYVYQINPEWEVSPQVLVQVEDGFDPVYRFIGKVRYQSRLWVGAGFSPDEAISGLVGVSIGNSFNVSYSYDHSIGEAGNFNLGSSHELIIGIPLFNHDSGSRLFW